MVCVHVSCAMCMGSTSGLVVVRSEPLQCRYFSITPLPPAHPAVKWVPSLFKARVDKTTDCGDPPTSGGLGGTSGAHTTNNWCSQCSCEYPARLQEFILCWP